MNWTNQYQSLVVIPFWALFIFNYLTSFVDFSSNKANQFIFDQLLVRIDFDFSVMSKSVYRASESWKAKNWIECCWLGHLYRYLMYFRSVSRILAFSLWHVSVCPFWWHFNLSTEQSQCEKRRTKPIQVNQFELEKKKFRARNEVKNWRFHRWFCLSPLFRLYFLRAKKNCRNSLPSCLPPFLPFSLSLIMLRSLSSSLLFVINILNDIGPSKML